MSRSPPRTTANDGPGCVEDLADVSASCAVAAAGEMTVSPRERVGPFHRGADPLSNGRGSTLYRELSLKGYLTDLEASPQSPLKGHHQESFQSVARSSMALLLGNPHRPPIVIVQKTNWRLVISLSLMIMVLFYMTGGYSFHKTIPLALFKNQPLSATYEEDITFSMSIKETQGECGTLTVCKAAGPMTCGELKCFGRSVYCGSCLFPSTCGGGSEPNQCGCSPKLCSSLGRTCGSMPDGCGGVVECGPPCEVSAVNDLWFGRKEVPEGQQELLRIGYFANWAQFRKEPTKMGVEELQPQYFSHIIYAFAAVEEETLSLKQTVYNDDDKREGPDETISKLGMWRLFSDKCRKGGAVPMIAIGGYDFMKNKGGEKIMSDMVQDPKKRARFIRYLEQWLFDFKFLGVSFSWDSPTKKDGLGLLALLRELRAKFDQMEKRTGSRYWLSLAVPGNAVQTDTSYPDKRSVADVVDWVSVMCYLMYGYQPWVQSKLQPLGPQAPLFSPPGVGSADEAMKHWRRAGVPEQKLVVGLSLAAKLWELESPDNATYGAMGIGAGKGKDDGSDVISLAEMRELMKGPDSELDVFHAPTVTAYSHKGSLWASGESKETIAHKVQYIVQQGWLGYMLWSLEQDYDRGTLAQVASNTTGVVYPAPMVAEDII